MVAKSLVAVLLSIAFICPIVSGKDGEPNNAGRRERIGAGREQAQARLDKVAKDLNLTEEQKTQLKAAFEEQRSEAMAIRNDTTLTQEQRMQKMQDLRTGMQDKVKSILTPEQFEKWQKMRPGQGQMMRPGRGGPRDANAPGFKDRGERRHGKSDPNAK